MHIHILGICGTFMAGIALLAKQQGHHVTGSDENIYPPMSGQLQEQGITLFSGYDISHLDSKPDQIVIGNAMKRGMTIIEYILNEGMDYTSGPAWLAQNLLANRWVLAVSGTHGKTTTSSLLTWILETCGLHPSFLIGGVPENFGVSARLTHSPFFVIEADEYDSAFFDKRSKFIHYHPRTLVINNLEFDHADIFTDLADIQKQFHHLMRTVPSQGQVIAPIDEKAIADVMKQGRWSEVVHFGLEQTPANWSAKTITADGSRFAIYQGVKKRAEIAWNLIGQHNVHNALAALLAALHTGVNFDEACQAFASFKNVKRRLEIRGQAQGITVYDDFAHHPTAIATTLDGLRQKVGNQRIIAVLELGSYTMRSGVHKEQIATACAAADQVIFLRPAGNWGIDAVADALHNAKVLDDVDSIVNQLSAIAKPNDHILVMSNGGFGGIHERILDELG